MRLMSLNLLKGTIDEVSRTVSVAWIQPRELDRIGIARLGDQLKDWSERYFTVVSVIKIIFFSFHFI